MRRLLLGAALIAAPALADQQFPATLAGHAILPAATFIAPPAGALPGFAVSGRYTGPGNRPVQQPESIPGATGPAPNGRPTGIALPFRGQPVQGFSGIKPVGDGSYWVLTDNGFGNKRNSPDALLFFSRVRPDFGTGQVRVEETVFLRDPDRVLPFAIATDATAERFLTGADLDPESIQPVGEQFYIGEEFGPSLIRVDRTGKVTGFWETTLDGKVIRSPDNHANLIPADPTQPVAFQTQRSGGYEGMAASPDGKRLFALLEKPVLGADGKPEGQFLRIIEFSTETDAWTGRALKFALTPGATAIGDFNMIDDRRALIIERDDGEGDPARACAQGRTPPACFHNPARVKRVTLVDLGAVDAEGFVRKIGHIDLMAIADPDGQARQVGDRGENAAGFIFPFFTIENVAMVDADHIIVGNDNNLPFSAGRHLTRADDNEFILLRVPELLRAR